MISFKDEHFENADFPIFATEEGMIIWTNDLQPAKESFPIFITDEEIAIFFKEEHSANDESSISVTDDGIETSDNFLHPLNVFDLICTSG